MPMVGSILISRGYQPVGLILLACAKTQPREHVLCHKSNYDFLKAQIFRALKMPFFGPHPVCGLVHWCPQSQIHVPVPLVSVHLQVFCNNNCQSRDAFLIFINNISYQVKVVDFTAHVEVEQKYINRWWYHLQPYQMIKIHISSCHTFGHHYCDCCHTYDHHYL